MQNNNIFQQLKKRKVFRSCAIYAGASFIILQVCSIIFPALLLPEWSIRLLVILLIIGFPMIIIFSWIYDITDKGIVKTESTKKSNNNYATVLLIFLIIVGFFYVFKNQLLKPSINSKSIAVLPFDNYSPNDEDDYLSSGFTEVIIANLAKVKDLMVISRTSVMRYKNTKMSLKDIAKELNVANILEGSIQKTGNKIRVVGQLIETSTDKHIWAETYDSDFDDIFSIQTSIATEIASALKSQITDSEKSIIQKKKTENIQAYNMYMKVKELKRTNYYNNAPIRKDLLNKIIDLDPQFAEAYAQMSLEYSNAVQFGLDQDIEKSKNKSKEYIEKAFDIKPESSEVREAYGWYYYACYRDYTRAIEHYKYALSKEPGSSDAKSSLGFAHRRLGNKDECIKYLEEANKLDPNHLKLMTELLGTYLFYKQYNKIDLIKFDKDYYRIDPTDGRLYANRARNTWWIEGNTINARKIIDDASKLFPEYDYYSDIIHDLDIYDQNYDTVLNYYIDQGEWINSTQQWILTNYHPLTIAYWLMDNSKKQKYTTQKALELMKKNNYEGDPRYHSSLGYIHAFSGNKEDAIREIKMALALCPPSKDVMLADHYKTDLSIIYAIIGEHEKSLDLIEELISGPSNFYWTKIKYHWILNKIFKKDTRFKNIIAKDEERFRKEITYDLSIYLQ